jgi:hypothetical protein
MATTQNTYTGNGSTTNYSFTFEYLKQADVKVTLDSVATTAFTFANATTISFTTAPANGVAIRIFRQTAIDLLSATFFPGSAIKAEDLNQNFTQSLYVTQESDSDALDATTTANTAKATADTALTNSATAISTANTASATATTADTNASAAVTTANAASATATTASTDAASAVTTANTASTNASAAVTTANAATTTANGAVTTANSAAADATTAISTANSAVTTANTASTNATNAVNTANTANTNASAAVVTANTADTNATAAVNTANAASAAVSQAVLFTLVANVAAIPGSPSNNDYIEIGDSTGIESFTPLSGIPSGFVGASGLTVRLRYDSSVSSWVWLNYFANDSETRYLTKNLPVVTGDATNGSGQITLNCEVNTHGVKIKGPPHSAAANYTLTLPDDTGTNGYVLKTDGSGNTSWGGADVVFDTTPQLGGDLDVNNKDLINGDTKLRIDSNRLDLYFGSSSVPHLNMDNGGDLTVMNSSSTRRGIAFYGGYTNNHLTLRPPTSFTTTTYYLPTADGTANQVLTTDGSGNMSWSNGGSPTIDAGNFDSGGSLVTTSQTFDGGSFD